MSETLKEQIEHHGLHNTVVHQVLTLGRIHNLSWTDTLEHLAVQLIKDNEYLNTELLDYTKHFGSLPPRQDSEE